MTGLQHGHTQLKLYYYATFILIPYRSTGNFLKIIVIHANQPDYCWIMIGEVKSNQMKQDAGL